jgi:hypothetical protein
MQIIKVFPGIPADILTRNKRLIEQLIETKGLVKIQAVTPVVKGKAPATGIEDRYLLCGGNWAHIHWNGEIYNFTEKAWEQFSSAVMKDFSTKLAKASNVSMDQINVVAKAMDMIQTG